MAKLCRGLGFSQEAVDAARRLKRPRVGDLERDLAVEDRVVRAKDRAEGAGAEAMANLESPQAGG